MLTSEDFGRGEERRLMTRERNGMEGECGYRGLAGSDIAVQEAIHRPVERKIGENGSCGRILGSRESERKRGFEGLRVRWAGRNRCCVRTLIERPHLECFELE